MIKFELSEQMVSVIGQALAKQPFDIAAPVITELQKQINSQQKPNGKDIVINESPVIEKE